MAPRMQIRSHTVGGLGAHLAYPRISQGTTLARAPPAPRQTQRSGAPGLRQIQRSVRFTRPSRHSAQRVPPSAAEGRHRWGRKHGGRQKVLTLEGPRRIEVPKRRRSDCCAGPDNPSERLRKDLVSRWRELSDSTAMRVARQACAGAILESPPECHQISVCVRVKVRVTVTSCGRHRSLTVSRQSGGCAHEHSAAGVQVKVTNMQISPPSIKAFSSAVSIPTPISCHCDEIGCR